MGVAIMAPFLKLLLLALVCSSATAEEELNSRSKRLFYVSTTSSTSTLKIQSICFVTKATILTCGKRKKKRSIESTEHEIDPTGLSEDLRDDVDELVDLVEENKLRKPRFLIYWMTTTSLSTLTSYTTTVTVASLACTPSNFGHSECGRK